ncbi:MAG: type II toxin-antitoxin system HicA family toxin [Verrucomicrobiota bacterium]
MKTQQLLKHLRSHGCRLQRHGSSHDIWVHDENNTQSGVPRHRETSNRMARVICKQLGIPDP